MRAHSHETRNVCFWCLLLKVSLRTHNHMLSTQLPRLQAYTHTQKGREGPWLQGMVSCKKKPPFLDLLRSISALIPRCKNEGWSKVSAKTMRAPATRRLQSQAALLQLSALNLLSKVQALADVPYVGFVFGTSFVAVDPLCICMVLGQIEAHLEPASATTWYSKWQAC